MDVCFFVQLANRLTCWVEAEFPGYFYTRRDGSAVMGDRCMFFIWDGDIR